MIENNIKKIKIMHLPETDQIDKDEIYSHIEKTYDKINDLLPGELVLEIHFKKNHQGNDKREKFEIKAGAIIAGFSFHSSFSNWDIGKTLKQSLLALERETIKAKNSTKVRNPKPE